MAVPIDVIAAKCDMAHDWGSTRVVPQLKQQLSGAFKDYLLEGLTYPRGPEVYFANHVSANDASFQACDISVFPLPITDLSAYPTANYFCIQRDRAETRDASSGNTIFTPEYMNFLSNFFGRYRGGTLQVVDPSKGAGMVFVEDAQSFGDWAFDTLPPGVNPPYPAEDKPPRGVAGPVQVLDSASVSSSWFKNISSSGIEPGGIGRWTVDMSGAIPENQYIWKDYIRGVPREVRLTLLDYPGGVQQIVFPAKMTSGPSLRVLSALMCAYLKKMGTPGTTIRNYMIDLLQYVPPVPPAPNGTRKALKSDMMAQVIFLAPLFEGLFLTGNHDFNLKLIAFLKYVGDKGQNIYAGGIGATAGTTGDRISAPSYVLFGNTPAIYRDGKKNHVFICPPGLASVYLDEDLRNPKYQFLQTVYTRVKQIISWFSRLDRPATGGAYEGGDIKAEFIRRGRATLGIIKERKQLNLGASDPQVMVFLKTLDDKTVEKIKANVKASLIFNVIRANYVKFDDDDLVPDDIDEFVSGYRPIKDDETGVDEAPVPEATGYDKAEEVRGEDPEVLARYYHNNYSSPPGDFGNPIIADRERNIWREIIFDLTILPVTPPRPPRADDATQASSASGYGDLETQLSVGPAPAPGSASRSIIPGSGSQSDGSSDAAPPPPSAVGVGDKRKLSGGLRFTIRRRSESRQTKKNRMRKPRMIDVRI